VIRYTPVSVENAWRVANAKRLGFESLAYRFDFSNGLSATGVWLKAISGQAVGPVTIVLSDKGYKTAGEIISERVNRGEQVLALDLLFNGASAPEDAADWEMLFATTGDRPLGLEAAQLLGIANWVRTSTGHLKMRIETEGIRNQVIASTAAAIEPEMFARIESHHTMESLAYLLNKPVPFRSAPDLFCLDLYKYFDLDRLSALADPTEIERIADHAALEAK
jgi:hypothetical protein